MVTSKKVPRGRQKKSAPPRATKKAKPAKRSKASADTCQATTVKGTQCRLKPPEGSKYCARHAEVEKPNSAKTSKSAPASPAMKNGQVRGKRKAAAKKSPRAEQPAKMAPGITMDQELADEQQPADPRPRSKAETKHNVRPGGRHRKEETPAGDDPDVEEPPSSEEEPKAPEESPEDPDAFYGSEFSTTMEASPYDDLITTEMAEGEEDVELRDEREFGRDRQAPQRPKISREDAEKKALERLGPRPEIAPEEDLDETLTKYDRRFENEVRRIMGIAPPGRGRRGGRRRGRGGGGGGGQQGGGGPGRGGGGRRRRGRRGGRGRQGGPPGSGGGPPKKRRGGPPGGAARKVGRDSPLAQKRSSKGPKGGMQPRRRRDPDV